MWKTVIEMNKNHNKSLWNYVYKKLSKEKGKTKVFVWWKK